MKYYVIYEYNEELDDVRNVAEFENRETLANWLGVEINKLYRYTTETIEKLPMLKDNKYFYIVDKED